MQACTVDGCGKSAVTNGFCSKHRMQMRRFGEVDVNHRHHPPRRVERTCTICGAAFLGLIGGKPSSCLQCRETSARQKARDHGREARAACIAQGPEAVERVRQKKRDRYWRRVDQERARACGAYTKYREQWIAHGKVYSAVHAGVLVRPKLCSVCGSSPAPGASGRPGIVARHHGYSEPLAVQWLCWTCWGEDLRTS